MRLNTYILIVGILGWCCFAGASYGPMPPSTLIAESEIIAIGRISVKDGLLSFTADSALKGSIDEKTYSLLFPEYVPNFEKKVLLEKLASTDLQRTIVLGKTGRDQKPSILLINSIFSIWPKGLGATIDNVSFDDSKDLVDSVMRYESVKNNPEKLLNELFSDISHSRFLPVVEYSQNRLADIFGQGSIEARKQVLAVAFARFLSGRNGSQTFNNQIFLDVSDSLPQTLAVPWLINIAKSKSNIAETAFRKVSANFRTRRLISGEPTGIDQIESIFNEQRLRFLEYDFKAALAMLDSNYEVVRNNSSILLGRLLGISEKTLVRELAAGKSISETREFWQKAFLNRSEAIEKGRMKNQTEKND